MQEISREAPDGILIMGGDTAYTVITELGCPAIAPIREVVSGVPLSRIAALDIKRVLPNRKQDLLLITKAGGFGDADMLKRVHAQLNDE